MQKFVSLCGYLYELSKVPMLLTDGNAQPLAQWPTGQPLPVPPEQCRLVQLDFTLQKRDETHPLILYVEPGYMLGVAKLGGDVWWMSGLVSPVSHTRGEILRSFGSAILPEYMQSFEEQLFTSPLVNLYQLKNLLGALVLFAQGQAIGEEDVLFCDNAALPQPPLLYQTLFDKREAPDPHVPDAFERDVCATITAGDREGLVRRMNMPMQGHVGKMTADALRQQRYTFVGFAVMVSRAAMQGGMEQEEALSLSDIYCQQMDALTDSAAIYGLLYHMALDFCQRVAACKDMRQLSPCTRQCVGYISQHLHQSIRLEQLAALTGLCGKTVAKRFKQELGQTVAEYIHAQKVQEACYLLGHSEYSLADISVFLDYPSQSYFTKVFKNHTGLTPQQYRSQK